MTSQLPPWAASILDWAGGVAEEEAARLTHEDHGYRQFAVDNGGTINFTYQDVLQDDPWQLLRDYLAASRVSLVQLMGDPEVGDRLDVYPIYPGKPLPNSNKPVFEEPEDVVNHPAHYTAYKGIEVIQLTEQMNFNRGNAVKYIARAGLKDPESEVQDLEKARWYIDREIARLNGEN